MIRLSSTHEIFIFEMVYPCVYVKMFIENRANKNLVPLLKNRLRSWQHIFKWNVYPTKINDIEE